MSFETASVTSCGQSLLARATATNKLVFVNARIETTTRTASAIGNATSLPTLTNPVTGSINSVTYSLNQTRVTVRFNNLATTANFHTVWLMAKLANEADSVAVPICAIVSSEPVYIPTTSQSDTHIDIHMNLSFVRANGTVSITEGPAWMISDHEQYRAEVRAEFDDVEADIAELQDTYVTKATNQTISGQKTFSSATQMNSTLKVTGSTTLSTTTTGTLTAGTVSSYSQSPRTASTSDSTGYDLGASNKRWKNIYGRHGNFEASISTDGDLNVSGDCTFDGYTDVGSLLVNGATNLCDDLYACDIYSGGHYPDGGATPTSGCDLGDIDKLWRYVYAQHGDFKSSLTTDGTLSVTGESTLTGNTTIGGTLDVTGDTTLGTTTTESLTSDAISSYSHTPRTASTSSSTGYNLGASDNRWKYVYARYGNFSYSLNVDGTVTATTFSGDLSGKFTTARNIDGMAFDGSASITHFGTCDTAAGTAAKTVSLSGFSLVTGARILVKFTNSNTASSPTLNVNGTGAVRIYLRVNTSASTSNVTSWEAGDTIEFVYDGTYWLKVNHTTNISGNAATATSATSSTYATYLRYSTTTVLTAAGTSTVTSAATIRPTTSGSYSLGSGTYKWNYIYANYLGSSSYSLTGAYITSAYCTNLYSSGTSAVKCLSLGTNTSYANDLEIPGSNADGSRGYLHPSNDYGVDLGEANHCFNKLYVKDIKAYGTIDGTLSDDIYSAITSRLYGTSVGSIGLFQYKRSSYNSTISRGTLLNNGTLKQCGFSADSDNARICFEAPGSTVSGTWKLINEVAAARTSGYVYCLVLAVRTA